MIEQTYSKHYYAVDKTTHSTNLVSAGFICADPARCVSKSFNMCRPLGLMSKCCAE